MAGNYPNFGEIIALNAAQLIGGPPVLSNTGAIINGTSSIRIQQPQMGRFTLHVQLMLAAASPIIGNGVSFQLQGLYDAGLLATPTAWAPLQMVDQATGAPGSVFTLGVPSNGFYANVYQTTAPFGCPFVQLVAIGVTFGGVAGDSFRVCAFGA